MFKKWFSVLIFYKKCCIILKILSLAAFFVKILLKSDENAENIGDMYR